MKVIFLDVDGVLNSIESKTLLALARRPLRLLAQIVQETGALLVLSSTWRHHPEGIRKLARILKYRSLYLYDSTPDLRGGAGESPEPLRGFEIAAWLDEHPGVERYIILDDLFPDDFLASQRYRLVQTSMATGLTEKKAREAIGKLI